MFKYCVVLHLCITVRMTEVHPHKKKHTTPTKMFWIDCSPKDFFFFFYVSCFSSRIFMFPLPTPFLPLLCVCWVPFSTAFVHQSAKQNSQRDSREEGANEKEAIEGREKRNRKRTETKRNESGRNTASVGAAGLIAPRVPHRTNMGDTRSRMKRNSAIIYCPRGREKDPRTGPGCTGITARGSLANLQFSPAQYLETRCP